MSAPGAARRGPCRHLPLSAAATLLRPHDGQEEASPGRRRGAGRARRRRRRVRAHAPAGGRLEPRRGVRAPSRRRRRCPTEIPEEPEEGSKKVDPLRNFVWADYGYSKDRRKFLPASKLAAPAVLARLELHRLGPARVPARDGRGQALPAQEQRRAARDRQAHRQGAVEAQARRARRRLARLRQRAHLRDGPLARQGQAGRGLRAATPRTGKILWKRLLPSRSESSPVFDNDRIYFGSENGTRLRAPRRRRRRALEVQGLAARSRAGSRWPTASSTSATTPAACTRSARPTAARSGHGHQRRRASACAPGSFYSTPAVAYGRVYVGNTDGTMYSFASSQRQAGVDARAPAPTSTPRPPWRRSRRLKPTVFFGSYDGTLLRARRAQRQGALDAPRRRQDLRRRDRRRRHRLLLQLRQEGHDRPRRRAPAERSSTWAAARSTRSSPTAARSS